MIDVQDAPVDEIHVKMPKHRGRREALAVNYAAKKLDELRYGWEVEIQSYLIIMTSMKYCVLGQIFGSFGSGLKRWYSHFGAMESASPFGVPVFASGGLIEGHYIKKAWLREIKARK